MPPLSETLVEPDANDPTATILELDELWSFVLKKANKSWIWIALCRKTRQVVARAVGDRSEKTCRDLWNNIPEVYQKGHCYSDFWAAYQAVIPEELHTAVGKETGENSIFIGKSFPMKPSNEIITYVHLGMKERQDYTDNDIENLVKVDMAQIQRNIGARLGKSDEKSKDFLSRAEKRLKELQQAVIKGLRAYESSFASSNSEDDFINDDDWEKEVLNNE